ncbi:hypothetical protein PGT21_017814 [Puccinia graminis f. sp. tritici]|nr:hypothetical protein PGT21_017814 [Puccinia graminis f. sp. tritici]
MSTELRDVDDALTQGSHVIHTVPEAGRSEVLCGIVPPPTVMRASLPHWYLRLKDSIASGIDLPLPEDWVEDCRRSMYANFISLSSKLAMLTGAPEDHDLPSKEW